MKNILYITSLPKKYGGESDGGIATHSIQLIKRASKNFKVGIYSNSSFEKIDIKNTKMYLRKENRAIKLFYGILGFFINRKKINETMFFLDNKKKIIVGYDFMKLKRIIKKYDTVHIHSLHNLSILSLSLLNLKCKIVVTDHGFWQGLENTKIEQIRYASKIADKLIYISDFSKEKIKEYKLEEKNMVKISNPYEINELLEDRKSLKEKLKLEKTKQIIFFSGVSEPVKRKGLDILIDAFEKNNFLKTNTQLIILTNEEGFEFCKTKNINDKNIKLMLPMEYENLIKLYKVSDVFVMPSRSESFGLVYIESLSYGTPIIGFNKVINEFNKIYDSYIGESFNPKLETSLELSKKIEKVLKTNINRKQLKKETILKFSWDSLFKKFEKLYY